MENLITLKCTQCGAPLEVGKFEVEYKCPFCGTKHRIKKGISESNILCPICGSNDTTRKVSTIIAKEEKIASLLRMPNKPEMPGSRFNVPPAPPVFSVIKKNNLWLVLLIVSGLFILGSICTIISSIGSGNNGSAGTIISNCILLAIFGFLAFTAYKKIMETSQKAVEKKEDLSKKMDESNEMIQSEVAAKKQEYEKWLKKWENAYENYKKLYYCERDNVVFIPGYQKAAPISEMQKFIYSLDIELSK